MYTTEAQWKERANKHPQTTTYDMGVIKAPHIEFTKAQEELFGNWRQKLAKFIGEIEEVDSLRSTLNYRDRRDRVVDRVKFKEFFSAKSFVEIESTSLRSKFKTEIDGPFDDVLKNDCYTFWCYMVIDWTMNIKDTDYWYRMVFFDEHVNSGRLTSIDPVIRFGGRGCLNYPRPNCSM